MGRGEKGGRRQKKGGEERREEGEGRDTIGVTGVIPEDSQVLVGRLGELDTLWYVVSF